MTIGKTDRKSGGGKWVDAHNYIPVRNDSTTDAAREFIEASRSLGAASFIVWGGNYFTDFLPPSRCWIVWDKQNTGNFADAELAWTSFDKGVRLIPWLWNGLARKGDRATEGKSRFHPTQKPVGLHVLILEEFNKDKRIVVDGFCGSGTTMIAAEKAGMTCYGMECEPGYVAVTLERLSKMGLEPRLVDDEATD